ncbi:hypothetical protein F5984_25585 [Rudanella paleaurantiibacter]|uniref:Uncharacterized protein n=1 Tax=Rudanella paleaurantiibacter TaxID=2614655 RepID=A0A7J5TS68_9BACT|nr:MULTISPECIES: hypothetical protein [Rudanella]KAB7725863.1 hypothetical protein F5984_25585 [Rudanella paleaurantiibacter]
MPTDAPPAKRKLIDFVNSYKHLLTCVDTYLQQDLNHPEVAAFLGISLTNYYTKRRGELRFTYNDVQKILERYGTPEEIAQYKTFIEVRDNIFNCLRESPISLAQYRRILGLQHYRELARRRDHPDSWKVEDLETVGLYMESLAYCIP